VQVKGLLPKRGNSQNTPASLLSNELPTFIHEKIRLVEKIAIFALEFKNSILWK